MIYGSLKQLVELNNKEPWHSSLKSLSQLYLESSLGISPILSESHFINIHTYQTKARNECRFESHNETIDLQYIINGEELIDITHLANLEADGEYSKKTDFQFHRMIRAEDYSTIHLKTDMVAIFFPKDPHRPQIAYNEKCIDIKKAVVKLPIALL